MPGDPLPVAWQLTKEMGTPADHVLAEQVLNQSYDARIRQQIVNAAVAQMRRGDGIAVAAGSQSPGQQVIEVTADVRDFRFAEDPKRRQIAVAIESRDLLARQSLGVFLCGRMKPQIAVRRTQVGRARDESCCW